MACSFSNCSTIEDAILKCVEKQDEWDEILDSVLFSIRISRHASTGISPYRMLYNKDPILPFQYKDRLEESEDADPRDCLNIIDGDNNVSVKEMVDELELNKKELFNKATVNITKAQKIQSRNYNKRNSCEGAKPLKMYDKVLKRNMKDKSRVVKGKKKFIGPFLIVGQTRSGFYLKNQHGHRLKRAVPPNQLVRYYGTMSIPEGPSEMEDSDSNHNESESDSETFVSSCQRSNPTTESKPKNTTTDSRSVPVSGQIIIIPSTDQYVGSSDDSILDVGIDNVMSTPKKNPWGDMDVNEIPIEIVDNLYDSFDSSMNSEIQVPKTKFVPLNAQQRSIASGKLCVRVRDNDTYVQNRGIGEFFDNNGPVVSIQAAANGACLFNTISLLLTGQEMYSFMFRHAICNYIADPKNLNILRPHIPLKYHNGSDYVLKSGMRKQYTWGTDVEIFACTHIIQFDVMVFSQQKKWLIYSTKAKGERNSSEALYINNVTGNHFDPVFSAIEY